MKGGGRRLNEHAKREGKRRDAFKRDTH
jgi:hypothetical protein